jgi:repressor of nif and glnA expression
MKKFSNASNKINVILSVFSDDEKLNGKEISKRIKDRGYDVDEGNLKMFIYYHMQYQYLEKEKVNGVNKYFAV